jgi:hypothetical protein
MSGVWVIRTEPWVLLHPILRQAVWDEVKAVCGIASITDMEVLSEQTIREWCLPADQSLAQTRTRGKRKAE